MKFVAVSIAVLTRQFRRFSKSRGAMSGRMVRQKNSRFLHLVLQSRVRRRSAGFSLILVFLMVLTVLTTTLSINSRLIAGQYAESLQGKLRMARNAAENGLILASSELNKPGNRLLLGNLPSSQWASRWDQQQEWPVKGNYYSLLSDNEFNSLSYECKKYVTGSASDSDYDRRRRPFQVTEQAVRMPTSASLQLETGETQSSRIVGFKLYDKDYNLISSENGKVSATEKSYLVLVAQGYYNSSTPYQSDGWRVDTASAQYAASAYKTTRFVLQQEYEVIPRCCGSSFAEPFGTDTVKPQSSLKCQDNKIVEWYVRGTTRASAHNSKL